MDKKQILEGNKIIIEFMGGKPIDNPTGYDINDGKEWYRYNDINYALLDGDVKFHSSWDWLIPALNKAYGIIEDFHERDRGNEERKYYLIATNLFNAINTFLCSEYKDGKRTEMYNIERAWKHLLGFIECYKRYNYEQEILKKARSKK